MIGSESLNRCGGSIALNSNMIRVLPYHTELRPQPQRVTTKSYGTENVQPPQRQYFCQVSRLEAPHRSSSGVLYRYRCSARSASAVDAYSPVSSVTSHYCANHAVLHVKGARGKRRIANPPCAPVLRMITSAGGAPGNPTPVLFYLQGAAVSEATAAASAVEMYSVLVRVREPRASRIATTKKPSSCLSA